jgi:hydroxypyruvate isomerase
MTTMIDRLDGTRPRWSRRGLLRTATALSAAGLLGGRRAGAADEIGRVVKKGRLKQSASVWCYKGKGSLDELAVAAKAMGLVGLDLLTPADFETLKKHDMLCTMVSAGSLANGLCDPKYHESSLKSTAEAIEATSKAGYRNVICFSGNARGIDRETGMANCLKALKEIVPVAEKAGVILNMELLNSKVNHKDYMCDSSAWGVELVKRVGSDNFKLLYDIYHMQIMEGDIIRTIEQDHKYFGHYHTGGNPGRHEIDDTQELNYKAVAKAIADTGYTGYIAHEYVPTKDLLVSLAEGVAICDQ